MAAETTENLVLEHLRYIRASVDALREDMREVKGRLGILESQYARLSNRSARLQSTRSAESWPSRNARSSASVATVKVRRRRRPAPILPST